MVVILPYRLFLTYKGLLGFQTYKGNLNLDLIQGTMAFYVPQEQVTEIGFWFERFFGEFEDLKRSPKLF